MIRFVTYPGEAFAGEYVDWPCPDCGAVGCDCDEEYRASHEEKSRWSKLTREEREAELQAIYARIDAAFNRKVENEIRFTMDMQRKDAA